MARAVTLGNGNVLVGLDQRGQVRDFYYPNVGFSNHVSGASGSFVHRIGVFAEGELYWLDDASWDVTVGFAADTVVGSMRAENAHIGVILESTDVVHNEANVFIRSFSITNTNTKSREIKIFFSQQFRISESRRGDTGFYDPRVGAIVHYKGQQAFLVNAFHKGTQFKDYNIGLFGIEGKEGTYFDAQDGILERNPIEHGSVDSIIGITVKLKQKESTEIFYWITCGRDIDEAHDLNAHILEETPEVLINSTNNYWKAWLTKEERDISFLSPEMRILYNRSLTTIRVHADNGGGIIASSDTDMLHHGRDTYSYVWPRDASIIAHALDRAGHNDVSKRYFTFMAHRLEKGGYLMHKYRADGVLGSSWHPWMQHGRPELPIQEDETAITVYLLWRHYELERDIEFIESLYNIFIEPAAEFMSEYMESSLGLPKSSYDLWEEKYGISTYTACSVYAALIASANFANLLGKQDAARTYSAIAQHMRSSILTQLYDEELGMFVKLLSVDEHDDTHKDTTLDMSSFFGPVLFGVLEPDDERVQRAQKTIEKELQITGASRGYVRYQGDTYYALHEAGSPNSWVITTLWMARYYIFAATKISELKKAYDILEWTCSHATPSGVLPEQMHPHTREHLSTAPLIWSHAEYVIAVDEYREKLEELSGSKQ